MAPRWHQAFLAMLPVIETHARCVFRHLDAEARQEAVQEVIATALVAFVRLVQLKKMNLAYPTVLARYAVAQVNEGRKVGGRLNIQDVSSAYCQRRKGVVVERLDKFDEEENAWREAVIVDTRSAPVPDIVAFRCDFPAWLARLSPRNREIALKLATNESPGRVARMFKLSAGRISQLRRELAESWHAFVGEAPEAGTASLAAARH